MFVTNALGQAGIRFLQAGENLRDRAAVGRNNLLDFREGAGSGRSYSSYGKTGELRGRVSADGKTSTGRLVFDLDEGYGWEMLDGFKDDISYSIPLAYVARIEPRGSSSTLVKLKNGQELVLGDTQDVSDDNDGVLVLDNSSDEGSHVGWDSIDWIEFD